MNDKTIKKIYEIIKEECQSVNTPLSYNPFDIARLILAGRNTYQKPKGKEYINSFVFPKVKWIILNNQNLDVLQKKGCSTITIMPEFMEVEKNKYRIDNYCDIINYKTVKQKLKNKKSAAEIIKEKNGDLTIKTTDIEKIKNIFKTELTVDFQQKSITDIAIRCERQLITSKLETKLKDFVNHENEVNHNTLKIAKWFVDDGTRLYINRNGILSSDKSKNNIFSFTYDEIREKNLYLIKNSGYIMVINYKSLIKDFRNAQNIRGRKLCRMKENETIMKIITEDGFKLETPFGIHKVKSLKPYSNHVDQSLGRKIPGFLYGKETVIDIIEN